MKIAFAGGDKRTAVAAELFAGDGFECSLTGFDDPGFPRSPSLKYTENIGECFEGAFAAVLPMPAFTEGLLRAPFSAKRFEEREIFSLCEGKEVFGGMLSKEWKTAFDYGLYEPFLEENARLTAEAALAILIGGIETSIRGGRFVIAGYGRIAKALTRMLLRLGGKVTVAARSVEQRLAAVSDGAEAAGFAEIEAPLERADAVINTVPHRVFGKKELCSVRKGVPFIELASLPGGADGKDVVGAGLEYLPSPGLPGKFFPVSAGENLYRCIRSILRERGKL